MGSWHLEVKELQRGEKSGVKIKISIPSSDAWRLRKEPSYATTTNAIECTSYDVL
jgi:hypothetical protein